MTLFEQEIAQQQYVLTDTYLANKDKIKDLAKQVLTDKYKGIALVGRGSSKNACWYFKYLVETLVGLPVVFINPSVVALYNGKYDLKDFLLIAVSQSGNAQDILQVVCQANQNATKTVAVTNDCNSPIAKACQQVLHLNVGVEKCVAATKTVLAQMTIFYTLATALDQQIASCFNINEQIATLLNQKEQISKIAQDFFTKQGDLFVLARGLSYVSAEEIALKFKETCYVNALSYSLSEFQHGPFALLQKGSRVLLFGNNDPTADSCYKLCKKIKNTQASLCVFSQDFGLVQMADCGRVLPKCDYFLTPFLQIVSGQLLACELSKILGINPDNPRNLNKITVTE